MSEPGTRKSRRTGHSVRPQKSTQDAWFDTFSEWSEADQEMALRVCQQIMRLRKRYLNAPIPQQQLPEVTPQ